MKSIKDDLLEKLGKTEVIRNDVGSEGKITFGEMDYVTVDVDDGRKKGTWVVGSMGIEGGKQIVSSQLLITKEKEKEGMLKRKNVVEEYGTKMSSKIGTGEQGGVVKVNVGEENVKVRDRIQLGDLVGMEEVSGGNEVLSVAKRYCLIYLLFVYFFYI
jgi:hypothetical protein